MLPVLYVSTYSSDQPQLGGAAGVDKRMQHALRKIPGIELTTFAVCNAGEALVPVELTTAAQRARVLMRIIARREAYQSAKFRAFNHAWSSRVRALREYARGSLVVTSQLPALLLARDAGVPVVCYIAHNIESVIAKTYSPSILRWLGDVARLESIERNLTAYASAVCYISAADYEAAKVYSGRDVTYLPVPLSSVERPVQNTCTRSVGFVGKASWPPNRVSLQSLVHDIFPLLRERHPDFSLHLAGRGTEGYRTEPSVVSSGELKGLESFWQTIGVLAVPRFGTVTGVSMKALEASEWGVPCVVTSEVAAASPGAPWLVADTVSGFAEKVHEAWERRRQLAEASMEWIRSVSPSTVGKTLVDCLTTP